MNKDQVLRSEAELYEIFRESEKPREGWMIGAEAEKFGLFRRTGRPVRYGDTPGIPTVLRALSARHGWEPEPESPGGPLIALRRGRGSVTLEPGSQLELSGAPWGDLHGVAAESQGHLDELRAISGELGIAWLGMGFHPFARQQDLDWVPKARYGIMQVYLPSRGAHGLDMMRRTATVQVNLDYSDERDAMRKLLVSLRFAPITTALFANSPFLEGQPWGGRSYRAQAWLDVDNDRAGLLPSLWREGASYEHYIRWALDAPMFLFKRGSTPIENTGQTFRSFLRHGFQGHRATAGDWELHVNTLFPEVRLKRTLEIRGADSQGPATLVALPALWTGIFYDERALSEAEALCADFTHEEMAEVRRQVPRLALQAPFRGATLVPVAQRLVEIAAGGLERRARLDDAGRDERIHLRALSRLLEQGRCPAEELLESVAGKPLTLEALLEHAELRLTGATTNVMDRAKLHRIGFVAHAHGWLSTERHEEASSALDALEVAPSAEAFWLERGYLDEAAFARVLDLLDGPPVDVPTQPYSDGPPSSLLRSVPSAPETLDISSVAQELAREEDPQYSAMTRVVRTIETAAPILITPAIPAIPFNQTLAGGVISTSLPSPEPAAPSPAPPLPFPPSTDPLRYRADRLLGAGGMGEVYECVDSVLGRRVAVKRLRPEGLEDHIAVAMLEREARVIGSLEHPNIIPVYDAGYLEPTGPFYAMRLVERPSLEVLLRKLRDGDPQTSAEFTLNKLLRALVQVCGAVDYAHSRGVIHCDLKPANILLGALGEVLVVDWGMAHSEEEASAYQGGTPGYMAPEQFEGRAPDPRTDVYALGAVLYEILTLRQAFPERSTTPLNQRRPVHPRARAPERAIPEELADTALRAMEIAPASRFPSASDFGAAIEAFLEGTRERERRLQRAADLSEQGDLLADSYEELLESRPERIAEVQELLGRTPPWESPEIKQPLWDAEDRQAVLDALCIRTFQSAVSTYEQALEEMPDHEAALRGLARLYRAELRRAHERRDDFDRVYFEGLLKQVDPNPSGSSGGTSLRVVTLPEPAQLLLGHVQEDARRLVVVREEALGLTPIHTENLATGSYLLRLLRPGFADVVCPVLLRPGKEMSLTLDLSGGVSPKPGEVFIPGGVALLGGDETNLRGRDLHEIDVPPFYIATFPVFFQEYFEFVAAMFSIDPVTAPRFLPRNTDGAVYWVWNGDFFDPTTSLLRWSEDRDYLFSLPVFGVDLGCAEAYARWKSESTGRHYRLPTEDEWEKAARGTDGRKYPWGDRFDASFCKMRESRPDLPAPEPCGKFAADESPYGVRDMAGGVAEWVLPPSGNLDQGLITQIASRGGAWCDWRVDCYLGARRAYFIEERSARVGFRLVREVRPTSGS